MRSPCFLRLRTRYEYGVQYVLWLSLVYMRDWEQRNQMFSSCFVQSQNETAMALQKSRGQAPSLCPPPHDARTLCFDLATLLLL